MDRCICCGRELDYEGTLICWECEKSGGALTFPGGELKESPQQFPIGRVIKYGQYQSARW